MGLFERDTKIYENRDALREDYQPDQLGRDEEIQMYQAALQPVINNEQPNNVFLFEKQVLGKLLQLGIFFRTSRRTLLSTKTSIYILHF